MGYRQSKKIGLSIVISALIYGSPLMADQAPVYKDSKQPVDVRVNDLLSRMTLDEKVAQLETIWQKRKLLENDNGVFTPEHAEELLKNGIGEIARPAENKTSTGIGKTPAETVAFTNAAQKWVRGNTRLGIPIVFHEESLHGHAGRYSTSFPQAIGLASSWDPELLTNIYSVCAQEIRRRGVHQALAPILDVARDPRWGRIEETMGEDPYLIASMGVAAVKGFQGSDHGVTQDHVMATLKHLAGHGEPTGGMNAAPTPVGERTLRELFLFPFEAVVKFTHPRSVMASYNEIDGVPSHANVKLINDILRKQWGFDGVLVSDYMAISELKSRHHLADSLDGVAVMAMNAGVDVETPDIDAYKNLAQLVKDGKIPLAQIDQAVTRVLREKFSLGLFENPFVDAKGIDEFTGSEPHRALSQKAAEESIVLLKNEGNLLPLDAKKLKSIAVIGPHVKETLLGGYSDVPKKTVSVLQGIEEYLGKNVRVNYARGTLITLDKWTPDAEAVKANSFSKIRWNTDKVELATPADTHGMIEEAVAAAQKSDVAVVVVGDNEAVSREGWDESHLGDRADLNLIGQQQELVDAILATGKPTIVVLNNGRPLSITKLAQTAPAIIEGWYMGQETGRALARVLFGDVNPSGKLPVSIARSVGHLPVYYNYKPTAKRGYAFSDTSALYPFGFGLSYTQFSYSDFTIDKSTAGANERVNVSVKVTNTGARAGDEIVQLYAHDLVATLTRPVKELKGFKRVSLKPKESVVVQFALSVNQLGFYNADMNFIVEPGKIDVMIGSSSQDIRAKGDFTISGDVTDIGQKKVFFSDVNVTKK